MRLSVRHRTEYRYSHPVVLSHNLVVSEPRETLRQRLLSNLLEIDPTPNYSARRRDVYGNWLTYFTLEEPHKELSIVTRAEVELEATDPIASEAGARPWESVRDLMEARPIQVDELYALHFLYPSPLVPSLGQLREYAAPSFTPGRSVFEAVLDLNCRIHRDFEYKPGSTEIATPLPMVLTHRRGVCQDFAHLLIGMLRSYGLAARYVSGYLLTTPPPGKPRLVGADASHAWASVYLPGLGWLDLDPTNKTICQQSHVTQAWGRDYQDVSPVRGVVLGGGTQTVGVNVDVSPVDP